MIQEDPLPTTAEDILNMADKYRNLDTGERFLVSAEQLTNDGGVALVYMSDFGRRILSKSTDWFMDGTFKQFWSSSPNYIWCLDLEENQVESFHLHICFCPTREVLPILMHLRY